MTERLDGLIPGEKGQIASYAVPTAKVPLWRHQQMSKFAGALKNVGKE